MIEKWRVRCKYHHWYPRYFNIEAITLYPFILFASGPETTPWQTFKHEMEHVNQVRRLGYWFYVLYVFDLAKQLWRQRRWLLTSDVHEWFWRSYWQIKYEFEARAVETDPLTTEQHAELGLPPHIAPPERKAV